MTQKLEGQWGLVTGAGRGIGRAIALGLAGHGCSLALSARTASELEAVSAECRQRGAPTTLIHPADLGRAEEVDRLADSVLGAAGHVDVLVNNAGRGTLGNPTEGDPDDWQAMLALNLLAPMRLTRRLAPGMVERQLGTIINLGSIAAIEGMKSSGAYAASKHGLRGWSLSSYDHLRGYGIKVVLINPAFVDTQLVSDAKNVDFERMLRPSDVAEAALLAVTTSAACCPQEITLRLTRYANS